MIVTILLPWPDRALSPNARGHWSQKSRAAASARKGAMARALERVTPDDRMLFRAFKPPLRATLTFHPKDKRRRDLDNLLAACKPAMDGVAQALGFDDSRIRCTVMQFGHAVKGGAVNLMLETII